MGTGRKGKAVRWRGKQRRGGADLPPAEIK